MKNGPEAPSAPRLGKFNTQAALAASLARHYGNRISIIINPPAVQDWRSGRRLPDGCPLPPAKMGNEWNGQEWVEWFDANLYPKFASSSNGQLGLIGIQDLEELKKKDEKEELEHRDWERKKERGDYRREVEDECARDALGLLRQLHMTYIATDEHLAPSQRRDKLRSLGVSPEVVSAFFEFDTALARELTDRRVTQFDGATQSLTA